MSVAYMRAKYVPRRIAPNVLLREKPPEGPKGSATALVDSGRFMVIGGGPCAVSAAWD